MITRRALFGWIGGLVAILGLSAKQSSAHTKHTGRLWYRLPLPGGGGQWLPADGGPMDVPEIPWHEDVPVSERKGEPILLYSSKSILSTMKSGGRGLRPQDRMNALVGSIESKRKPWIYSRQKHPSMWNPMSAHRETMQSPSQGFRAFFSDQQRGIVNSPQRLAYLKSKREDVFESEHRRELAERFLNRRARKRATGVEKDCRALRCAHQDCRTSARPPGFEYSGCGSLRAGNIQAD